MSQQYGKIKQVYKCIQHFNPSCDAKLLIITAYGFEENECFSNVPQCSAGGNQGIQAHDCDLDSNDSMGTLVGDWERKTIRLF